MNEPYHDPNSKDITWRYRTGLKKLIDKHPGVELILFIEDDDWYSSSYVEVFYRAWEQANRPDIFGIDETYYYHMGLRKFRYEKHPNRASAFCTGVSPEITRKMSWPNDNYSFVDLEMWKQLQGQTFSVHPPICIGMKGHNEGSKFGGVGHNDSWNGYNQNDFDLKWISSMIKDKYKKDMISFYFGNGNGPTGTNEPLGPKNKI